MVKQLLKKQTVVFLICFLVFAPYISLAQSVVDDLPNNTGQTNDNSLVPPTTRNLLPLPGQEIDNSPVEELPPMLDSGPTEYGYYDPITDTVFQDEQMDKPFSDAYFGEEDPSLFPGGDGGLSGGTGALPDPVADATYARREYNSAIQRGNAQGGNTQGYAYAGAPGAAQTGSTTTNTQGSASLSAASCIGSQLLGKLLASTITSAVGRLANTLFDAGRAVVGAIISVPTNELGTLKYDSQRTKEQIQLQNSATVGTSVGFAGISALAGISWDGIAYCIVNSMIDYIARSTIAWARSGFQGNPSFIQNPGQFFKQLADVEASTFLQNLAYGTLGANICQPFRAQIVLNIARDFTGGVGQTQVTGGGVNGGYTTGGFNGTGAPTATVGANNRAPGALGTTAPTSNGTNNSLAAKSASGTYGGCSLDQINANLKGFLGGNFNQGGWNSWLQLTQVAGNNPYTTSINLSAQLQGQIQKKQNLASVELNWGRGFMSFRKCEEKTPVKDQSKCPITTPGNLIESQLEKTLNISKERLVLAEKFDQVIAVIVDQLISTALNKVLDVR